MTSNKEEDCLSNNVLDDSSEDEEDNDYQPTEDEEEDNEVSAGEEEECETDSILSSSLIETRRGSSLDMDKKKADSNIKLMLTDEKKKRADELWADLLGSSSSKPASKTVPSANSLIQIKNKEMKTEKSIEKIIVKKEFDFAGEKVILEELQEVKSSTDNCFKNNKSSTKSVPTKRTSGVSALVSNLNKKQKLSTLTKTKMDWDIFKRDEGLEEELKNHTKNKDSYVDRQAFLLRTDLKQFEIEKSLREKNRLQK